MQITAREDGRIAAFYLATRDELSRLGERYLRQLSGASSLAPGLRAGGGFDSHEDPLDRDPPTG